MAKTRLTKTGFMRGLQCRKMLWLDKNKPEERIIPDFVKTRLKRGNDFGDLAMGMFGDFEEMTTYYEGSDHLDIEAMLKKTKEHIERSTPVICEAALSHAGLYCAVDILKHNGKGYDLYEVKDTKDVYDEHITDAAFQLNVALGSGVLVNEVFIVTHGDDEENPFEIHNISLKAREVLPKIDEYRKWMDRVLCSEREPLISMGDPCRYPHECWYKDYCKNTKWRSVDISDMTNIEPDEG